MAVLTQALPYCGAPPAPEALWTHWRLDPVVLALLAGIWLLYWVGSERLLRTDPHRAPGRGQRAAFHAGWLIATLALVSPLCPLSVSLFAARVSQHVVLTLIAAPLVACALPARSLLCALRLDRGVPPGVAVLARALAGAPLAAAAAFAMLIWFWHAPAVYEATFRSVTVYWLMHLSLFASALWLWTSLLRAPDTQTGFLSALLASTLSSVQMGLLGAVITLAPRALYGAHFLTTAAWGLTPLEDQQLGGVIMWVPGCGVFLLVAMIASARCLSGKHDVPPAHGWFAR